MGKLYSLIFTTMAFLTIGCYEPEEGCLDIDAVNYNVAADDPCASCCTFPSLTFSMQHVVRSEADTVTAQYGVFYPLESTAVTSDSFMLDRLRFFISNVNLIKEDGTIVDVEETLDLEFADGTGQTVVDNFAKGTPEPSSSRTIGTIKTEGIFTQIQLTIGLEEFLLGKEIVSTLASSHPLNTTNDTINYEAGIGIIPLRMIVRQDTLLASDSLDLQIFTPESITLTLEEPLVVERGFDMRLTMKTDYRNWFREVDLANDTKEVIEQKISANLTNVLEVVSFSLE